MQNIVRLRAEKRIGKRKITVNSSSHITGPSRSFPEPRGGEERNGQPGFAARPGILTFFSVGF